jgi:hypothetical protein
MPSFDCETGGRRDSASVGDPVGTGRAVRAAIGHRHQLASTDTAAFDVHLLLKLFAAAIAIHAAGV